MTNKIDVKASVGHPCEVIDVLAGTCTGVLSNILVEVRSIDALAVLESDLTAP